VLRISCRAGRTRPPGRVLDLEPLDSDLALLFVLTGEQDGMPSLTAERFVQGWGIGAAPPVGDYQISPADHLARLRPPAQQPVRIWPGREVSSAGW
jgi:hypothetical protein